MVNFSLFPIMKKIAFIAAMKEELTELLNILPVESSKTVIEQKIEITIIDMKNVQIIAALSGVGKVNAALTVSYILLKYHPDLVINVGVAGGFQIDQKIFDFVIAEKFMYTDVDCCSFGFELGQMYNEPLYFPADQQFVNKIKTFENNFDVKFHYGIIGSSDQFISKKEQVERIQKNFKDIVCVEMEGAAIAHVCYKFEVPIVAIRTLSDIAVAEHDNSVDFNQFLSKASKMAAQLCSTLINDISSSI